MIYLYLFGTCFHFIYVFMIIGKVMKQINSPPIPHNFTFLRMFVQKFNPANLHGIISI